jgi:hypothetical protein
LAFIALSQADTHEINALGYLSSESSRKVVSSDCSELANGGFSAMPTGVERKKCRVGFSWNVFIESSLHEQSESRNAAA